MELFNLGFVPLTLVKKLVVALNPNGPKGNALMEVPNTNQFDKFLTNPLTIDGLFPMESVIELVAFDHIKFMYNKHSPSPSSYGLGAILRIVFEQLVGVRKTTRMHCLDMEVVS